MPFYVNQGTWTNTASNKLLFDAGIQFFRYQPIFGHPAPDGITNLIPVTQQSNAINPATGIPFAPVANYRYRGVESWGPAKGDTDDITGSVSYVTGAHNMKVGYQYRMLDLQDDDLANDTQLGYRFNGLTPNAVSYYLPEMGRRTITKTHGIFVQDTWTIDQAHGAGRAAVGPRVELRAGGGERHVRQDVVPEPAADHHPGDEGRGRVQRPHAARGSRV